MESVPACTQTTLAVARNIETILKSCPQIFLEPEEHLHAGLYARTIRVPAGVILTGALIKIPTLLIVSGEVMMSIGDQVRRYSGTTILEGCAGRKTVFRAIGDVVITMAFASDASDFDEAVKQFTDEQLQEKDKCQEQQPPLGLVQQ